MPAIATLLIVPSCAGQAGLCTRCCAKFPARHLAALPARAREIFFEQILAIIGAGLANIDKFLLGMRKPKHRHQIIQADVRNNAE
jgi:hypothetical protein